MVWWACAKKDSTYHLHLAWMANNCLRYHKYLFLVYYGAFLDCSWLRIYASDYFVSSVSHLVFSPAWASDVIFTELCKENIILVVT